MAVGVEVATLTLARPYSVLSCQRGQGFPCTVWVGVCVWVGMTVLVHQFSVCVMDALLRLWLASQSPVAMSHQPWGIVNTPPPT